MRQASISPQTLLKIKNKVNSSIEQEIDSLTSDALPYYKSVFKDLYIGNSQNAKIVCDFITTEINNQNITSSTKLTHVKILCWFSRYLDYKEFGLVTRDDIIFYLNSLRKPESEDPTHKWIGTYNARQMILSKFFRWFYNKDEFDSKE